MSINNELYTSLSNLVKEKKYSECYEIIKGIKLGEIEQLSTLKFICDILGNIDINNFSDQAAKDEFCEVTAEYFSALIKLEPHNTSHYDKIAKILIKANQPDSALLFYQKGIEENPNDYSLNMEAGILCDSMEKLTDAEGYYQKAIEISPDNPWTYAKLGDNFLAQKRSKEALGKYLKAVEIDSSYDYALSHIGYFYEQKGDYEEAIEYYHKAVKSNNKYDWAMGRLAESYIKLGDRKDARKWFLKAINLKPKESWYLCGVGYIDEQNKDYGSAISFYKKALEIESSMNDKWILSHTGVCYFRLNNKKLAIEYLKKTIYSDANYEYAFKKLLEILIEDKAFDDGIALFNNFIADNLSSPFIYAYLGYLYRLSNNYDKAIEIYDTGIEKYPENYLLYFRKGEVCQDKSEIESATQAFKRAIELKPDFTDAYYRLSLTYSLSNKIDDAERTLKKALELAPDELWLLYYMVSFYETTRKVDKADEMFGRILRIKDYEHQAILEYIRFCLRNFLIQKGYDQIQRILEKNPDDKEAKTELIKYYTLVQSRTQAIQIAKEIIKEDPEFLNAYKYYAMIYETTNPIRAIRILAKASQVKEDKWVLDKLGKLCMRLGRYRSAVRYFKRSLKGSSNDPYVFALIGNAYVFLKKYKEAIPYLEKSLSLIKFYPLSYTHYYLAACYYKVDKSIASLEKSEKLIRERLELSKRGISYSKYESFRLFNLLGQIKQRLKNYPEAIIAYSQASKYLFDAPITSFVSLPVRRLLCSIRQRFFNKSSDE